MVKMETMNFRLRHMEARMCSSIRKKKRKKSMCALLISIIALTFLKITDL